MFIDEITWQASRGKQLGAYQPKQLGPLGLGMCLKFNVRRCTIRMLLRKYLYIHWGTRFKSLSEQTGGTGPISIRLLSQIGHRVGKWYISLISIPLLSQIGHYLGFSIGFTRQYKCNELLLLTHSEPQIQIHT